MSHQSRMGEALELLLLAHEDIEAWVDDDHDRGSECDCSSHELLHRINKFLAEDKSLQMQEIIEKMERQESNRVDRLLKSAI